MTIELTSGLDFSEHGEIYQTKSRKMNKKRKQNSNKKKNSLLATTMAKHIEVKEKKTASKRKRQSLY